MDEFDALLAEATAHVSAEYMHMPVAGQDRPVYRERVYCYELYHHFRLRWPVECRYTLAGEVDKKGHPLVRRNGLDGLKPDFLVHEPGDMGGNYLVLEVKPVTATARGVEKDLGTIYRFLQHADYQRGALLVYGHGNIARICTIHERYSALHRQDRGCEIELWWHSGPESEAVRVA